MKSFKDEKIIYNGALLDPIDERDYQMEEVACYAPVKWEEKKTFRSFPVKNQDGSSSCVGNAVAKILGIENYLEEGEYLDLSARDIYTRRTNQGMGMHFREAMKIGSEQGATLEHLMPSNGRNEAQMNDAIDRTPYKEIVGRVARGGAYVAIPFNIDKVAEVIATGKGVLLGLRFNYNEYNKQVPEIINGAILDCHHGIAGVDYTLYKGKRAIIVDESWGVGNVTQRIITEDWFTMGRVTASWYFEDLKNSRAISDVVNSDIPKYQFTKDLWFGMRNADVIKLHEVLIAMGLLDIKEPTGYFGQLTKNAVIAYQELKGIRPLSGYVGPLTRAELNK